MTAQERSRGIGFKQRLGLALQGVALWHAVVSLPFASWALFSLSIILVLGEPPEDVGDMPAYVLILGLIAGVGAAVTAIPATLLAGASWALLGRGFFKPGWSLILLPGLIGTVAAVAVMSLMVGPLLQVGTFGGYVLGVFMADLFGVSAAYLLIRRGLNRQS